MNKLILGLVATVFLLGSVATVFAQGVPTQGNVPTGGGDYAPIVKAKAEWILTGLRWDDDSEKPYLQVNPPMGFGETVTLKYVVVATDFDGYDDLSSAYADVWHPDGSFKYQVELPNVISCTDNPGQMETWISRLTAADEKGLVEYDESYDLNDTIAQLRQCSAKLFYGTADLDYCQMCGQFSWTWNCLGGPPCMGEWTATDQDNGYTVEAYVFDQSGDQSEKLTNYFEYICQAGIETDFNKLDFQSVLYRVHKWIEGDRVWNAEGTATQPACNPFLDPNCVPPTIRNIGNIPMYVSVMQDDMQFGYSGPSTAKDWNVQWDARLGEYNEHTTTTFDPFQTVTLDGEIGLCQQDKISFSIFAEKITQTGTHTGNVTIEAVPGPFPWLDA